MQPLHEWCFTFTVVSRNVPDGLEVISESLIDEAIAWAEQRALGIGGSYKVSGETGYKSSIFRFGLTITENGQSISHQTAADLFAHLQSAATDRGCAMQGGFAEFKGL